MAQVMRENVLPDEVTMGLGGLVVPPDEVQKVLGRLVIRRDIFKEAVMPSVVLRRGAC